MIYTEDYSRGFCEMPICHQSPGSHALTCFLCGNMLTFFNAKRGQSILAQDVVISAQGFNPKNSLQGHGIV